MDVDAIRRFFEPAIRRVLHFRWRFSRGLTVGVRGLVFDPVGPVFLIKHSYVAGWHSPGGGVEHGESLATALGRELREEGNIELLGPAELYGIYWNRRTAWRDHVALYVVRSFRQTAPPRFWVSRGGFWGGLKSIRGPIGTMPGGFTCRWLP